MTVAARVRILLATALGVLALGVWPAVATPASPAQHVAGNALAVDNVLNFFFLNGDANRDRNVNLSDFTILAANFNGTGKDFSQADFNYDTKVDLTDFTVLAARFNAVLNAPAPSAPLAATSSSPSSPARPGPAAGAPAAAASPVRAESLFAQLQLDANDADAQLI